MRRVVFSVALVALGVAAVARAARPAVPEGFRLFDRIRAVVDSEVVTQYDLARLTAPLDVLARSILDPGERARWLAERRRQALDQMIDTLLVLREARKLDLQVSPQEIDQHIAALQRDRKLDAAGLDAFVRKLGFRGVEDYRDHYEREMLKARTLRLKVGGRIRPSREEVMRAFRQRFHGGEGMDQIHAQHILIRVPNLLTPDQMEALSRKAHEVWRKAIEGTTPFEELARLYSDDLNRDAGGDLGWLSPCTLDPEFERHAFSLKAGEVSNVVRTNFGFHVIRVVERRTVPIEDEGLRKRLERCVAMEIEQDQFQKAVEAFTRELRLTYHYVVFPEEEAGQGP